MAFTREWLYFYSHKSLIYDLVYLVFGGFGKICYQPQTSCGGDYVYEYSWSNPRVVWFCLSIRLLIPFCLSPFLSESRFVYPTSLILIQFLTAFDFPVTQFLRQLSPSEKILFRRISLFRFVSNMG